MTRSVLCGLVHRFLGLRRKDLLLVLDTQGEDPKISHDGWMKRGERGEREDRKEDIRGGHAADEDLKW